MSKILLRVDIYMESQPYSVDSTDGEIGYVTSMEDGVPMFHGDYSAWDGSYRSEVTINGVHAEKSSNTIDLGDDISKVTAGQVLNIGGETYTVVRTSANGKVTLDKNLAGNVNGTLTFLTKRRYCDPTLSDEQMASLESSKGITDIDAIMYTNHWIGGKVGNITITGSMIGRDEGMIISGGLELNWDPRIKYSPLRHILPTTIKPPRTIVRKEY